jgi:S1-C subfamily serine protease
VVEPDGRRAMRVTKVHTDTPAEKAGLQPGDVIRSANGYLTQVPGNLTWIIDNAAADKVLNMKVLAAKDGREHTVTATVQR